jgi:hypothetical protein
MVECEQYYIESGSLVNSGQTKETTQFPYFDHYNVVTGSFPTTGSRSLLFNNEAPVYGQQPNETLFTDYWSNYVELLYNPKTRLITAKAIIPLADYFDMELNDVINWRGNYYHLRAINDYNLKTGECGIQLLGPIIAYTLDGYTPPPAPTTTTTTAAPATVRIHLEEYNASPTAFLDLNLFANGESFFFSGDFSQSVAPNTSDVEMEVPLSAGSQVWGPYTTASATLSITENGSSIFNDTTTYYSGSSTFSVIESVNFQSGRTYIISASNQPVGETTTTTTTTTFPVGYYYSIDKYQCSPPLGPCSLNDAGLVAYSSSPLTTGNYYNASGDGFVYLVNIELDNPEAYDINLSLAPSNIDCVDACNI